MIKIWCDATWFGGQVDASFIRGKYTYVNTVQQFLITAGYFT
jgi:hypothetical protein